MTIPKQIKELVRSSRAIRTPKQALEALFQMAFITLPPAFARAFPASQVRVLTEYIQPQDLSDSDRAKLSDIFRTYLHLVRTSEPFDEFLGGLYDEYLGEDLGQFFTPPDVAKLLAEISSKPLRSRTFLDFCTGGGSLILAAMNRMWKERGMAGVQEMDIQVQDIDDLMCKLTAIQIVYSSMIHQVPFSSLEVINGNVLTLIDNQTMLYVIPSLSRFMFTHTHDDYPAHIKKRIAEHA